MTATTWRLFYRQLSWDRHRFGPLAWTSLHHLKLGSCSCNDLLPYFYAINGIALRYWLHRTWKASRLAAWGSLRRVPIRMAFISGCSCRTLVKPSWMGPGTVHNSRSYLQPPAPPPNKKRKESNFEHQLYETKMKLERKKSKDKSLKSFCFVFLFCFFLICFWNTATYLSFPQWKRR